MALRVRRYTPDDEDALFTFREKIFPEGHKSLDRAHFRWKFLKHPYADELPFFIMEHDGKVVGTQGYWPFLLRIGNKRMTCSHLVDFNVDDAYRGLPTLRLFKAVCSCSELNFGAYLSSDAKRFFAAANWIDISSHLKNYYCFISAPAKAGLIGKSRSFFRSLLISAKLRALTITNRSYTFKLEPNIPTQADEILRQSQNEEQVCLVKEKKFLNWRYEPSVRRKYNFASVYLDGSLKCFLIFKIIKDSGLNRCFIMDIIHTPGEKRPLKILLIHLAAYLKNTSDVAVLQSAALPTLGNLLLSCGFSSNDSNIGFMLSHNSYNFTKESNSLSRFNFVLGDTDFL
ncbi:hypothetical protein Geob_2952 [Geotalea daltonii FRC-32]|uniref:N-acetyltransferase domain-containing protein n=1 Tax=Geotalea daltonii (strain DSM 22248 / JCM 15807 / FRC-32) TaxID=316067 RepID=B9M2U9_GEODF|nr:GNAT family N-acetyltransferase [Geotalea daltonii]ACM21295.1 hypothetical protein Geob_2952 [Geotalea daltonii FRC-32]